jgi:hypothetical protein
MVLAQRLPLRAYLRRATRIVDTLEVPESDGREHLAGVYGSSSRATSRSRDEEAARPGRFPLERASHAAQVRA